MEPRPSTLSQWLAKLPTPFSIAAKLKRGMTTAVWVIQENVTVFLRRTRGLPPEQGAFTTLFFASPVAICICTLQDGRIVDVNDSFVRMMGYAESEVNGRTWRELGLWENPDDYFRLLRALAESGSLNDVEIAYHPKGAETHYALLSAEQFDWSGKRSILMLAYDITERKRTEERQQWLLNQVRASRARAQALSKRLLDVQEDEHRHLARELHDEIGQSLTGLRFVLGAAARAAPENIQPHFVEAQTLVNDLIRRVRDLSLELRPAMLDDLGLLPALLWLIERYTHQTQIQIDFGHSGLEKRFPPEIETAAYRIVQEALTNIARHAHENEAAVRLWVNNDVLFLQVEDWGAGFDVETALAKNVNIGLSGMQERALALGGRLEIESVLGVGTRVQAEFPVKGQRLERRKGERYNPTRG